MTEVVEKTDPKNMNMETNKSNTTTSAPTTKTVTVPKAKVSGNSVNMMRRAANAYTNEHYTVPKKYYGFVLSTMGYKRKPPVMYFNKNE